MPKAIDHDQRRREIIDATWGLIVKGGLEAATMREIAAEAGFANGALKHYFPGKDEIITGAYERAMQGVVTRLEAAVAGLTGIAALRASVRATMPLDDESREAARVLLAFWERGLSSESISASYGEHLGSWHAATAAMIAECRAEGTISTPIPDDELVDEIILLNVGATVLSAIGPRFAQPASLDRLLDDFFARLGSPEPASAL